jgi:hypothetical protein
MRPSWIPPGKENPVNEFFKKIRPQIILAIFVLGLISTVALVRDGEQYIAVVTGCTGGIIALGMKLLDGE